MMTVDRFDRGHETQVIIREKVDKRSILTVVYFYQTDGDVIIRPSEQVYTPEQARAAARGLQRAAKEAEKLIGEWAVRKSKERRTKK